MAIYARLENGTYAEVTGVYKTDGTEITEIFQGDRLVYSAANEIYGTVPLYYDGLGYELIDYLISGNAIQDGTPSADAPVEVQGCGVRTGNVMPAGEKKTVERRGIIFSSDGKGKYTISGTATAAASVRFDLLSAFTTPISVSNGGQGTLSFFNTQSNNNVTFLFYNGETKVDDWKMTPSNRIITAYNAVGNKYVDSVMITVTSGTTVDMTITPEFTDDGVPPSEFEPYGYKLPPTVNGTEHPIYLGEVETTRRIKKLVLTGEKEVAIKSGNAKWFIPIDDLRLPTTASILWYCSHYQAVANNAPWASYDYMISWSIADIGSSKGLRIRDVNFLTDVTVADFKSYLAAQYAAGTPVTVWYVLAEPETGIVNEPLMKIGDYADTISAAQAGVTIPTVSGANVLDMASTVKPSEMYIKGKGIKQNRGQS